MQDNIIIKLLDLPELIATDLIQTKDLMILLLNLNKYQYSVLLVVNGQIKYMTADGKISKIYQ